MILTLLQEKLERIPRHNRTNPTYIIKTFDTLIDWLRQPSFPSPEINALTTLTWRLVGNRIIRTALNPDPHITEFFFGAGFLHGKMCGLIFIPHSFLPTAAHTMFHQLGAVVHMASQSNDYILNELHQLKSPQRARLYESELLHRLRDLAHEENIPWTPSNYQQQLLQYYPHGLKDAPAGLLPPIPNIPTSDALHDLLRRQYH